MRRAQRAHARETQGMVWVGEGGVNLWSVTASRRCSTDRKSLCHSSGRFEFTDLRHSRSEGRLIKSRAMHWVASQVPELVDGSNTDVLARVGNKWTVSIVGALRMGHFEITR
jgi:hypothetical protein